MNASEKLNGYGEWRHMETMEPTQARIPMLNGILLLQAFIFQYSNMKLLHIQLRIEISLPQWVTDMLSSHFHTSEFRVAILSICCPR